MRKHNLSWRDVLDGKALPQKGGRPRTEIGVDYLEAAQSRIRQLQAHNAYLEKQIRRLKTKLEEIAAGGTADAEDDPPRS